MTASVKISEEKAWKATLGELELQMVKATFNTWLSDTVFLSNEDGVCVVGVRNTYAKDWLDNRLRDTVKRTLLAIDASFKDVQFVVMDAALDPGEDGEMETAERPYYLRRDISVQWGAVLKAYSETQRSLQPKSCWQLLNKLDFLIPDGTTLQLLSSDPQVLENLNRIANWRDHLQQQFHEAGLFVDVSLSEQGSNGRTNGQASGSKRKKKGRDGRSGGEGDSPVQYRNIRPPTDPLGSFVKTSHYAIRFWRPYLGADAFDLLQIISSYAYEFEVLKKDGPSVKTLAAKMGRGDVYSLVGRSSSGEGTKHRKGKYGWLNELRDHHLCDHKQVGHGRGAKQYFDYLTKVSDLPLLTPKQVANLSDEDQAEHEEWLRLHTGIDYDDWASDTRGTRVPGLPVREDG